MLTVAQIAALPDDDPRKIVDHLRRHDRPMPDRPRQLTYWLTDEEAAEALGRIIAAARRAERERCAQIADQYPMKAAAVEGHRIHVHCKDIAEAIRALLDNT